MLISLIVATARNGVIGRNGTLPWHLPDDLRRFKQLTLGKPIVMGRRTYASIGKPLPGRRNIVVSRTLPPQSDVHVVPDFAAALRAAQDAPELIVAGGAALYREALPQARRIYLTEIDADIDGDVHFPPLDRSVWRETCRERHPADARHAYPMDFVILER
ncbi:MAG: dihydrofolate reductase [Steroidobacteraceae bacterium]|nr:dihydrofolate reductase [Steroidobacteraceae bacterium]MDW8260133.1 dihydrofolate reductase [Gammaproteobacteria bacterium]